MAVKKILNQAAKPTPFKIGCLVVLLACLVHHSFGHRKPEFLTAMDNRLTDAMFLWRGRGLTTGSVVIVDLDEKSLKRIGQWPWPRNRVAELIDNINKAGAKVIGLDIFFAEEDRSSPHRYLDTLNNFLTTPVPNKEIEALRTNDSLNYDRILGNALAASPAVLGYFFQTINDGLKSSQEVPFPSSNIRISPEVPYHRLATRQAYRALVNIPEVAQAETEGFFNVFPDASGTVRAVPLIMSLDNLPYPSLALEMVRFGLGEPGFTIQIASQELSGKRGIQGISLAGAFIPTNDSGEITVNYRGPTYTFPYISAVDILNNRHLDMLRDNYVLIGSSAAGLLDTRATPFSNIFPGVEIHATIIDNILAGDFFSHDIFTEIGLTYTLTIIGGVILALLLARTGPLVGAIAGTVMAGGLVAGNYSLFFLGHELVGLTFTLLSILAVFMIVTLFNYFFAGRDKNFIQDAFAHYVSPQVVNQLMKTPERLSLTGEQKNLTVLFSDIRNFTNISEKIDSARLSRFMNNYLTAMSGVIFKTKGTVDKYIGDAIMAIWGAPLADPNHAANAIRAAFRMRERLEQMQDGWQQSGLPPIRIGIGINTGIMSVGNFGSEQRFDYTVMGDNVNLASRLESSTKIYGCGIIISEFTRLAAGDNFFCRFVDSVRVKGKEKPVSIYEPLTDGPPSRELRQEVEKFNKALTFYRDRDFPAAQQIIIELLAANNLPLYRLYLARIESFIETPPAPDWDGVYTFTSK